MGTNTGIGIGIGIPFRNNALGGDNIYFPPELKARMIGVWDNYGKKNTDADRNIIKNKIPNAGGDLEILNSAYKLNSGFGEYREDFTSWIVSKEPMTVEKTDSQVHISYIGTSYKELPMFEYSGPINENYSLTVEIQGIPNNVIGKFIHNNGFTQEVTNGINTIKFSNSGSWYGFTFYREDNTIIGDCNITIKQIPAFEGALVTDGINDIIASIKTLEDWNIGNKGITIVSMIHQINANKNFTTTNNLRNENRVIGRNTVTNIGKTGIYGWYKKDIQGTTATLIDNILGDKNDYTGHYTESTNSVANSKFYVQGYAIENGFTELSSVAHYWTFAVLGKATEDEINLIIAKYNLDRTLRPDILCNIERQGITNDNHADFNDKLVDYSGNGRDIQMYNLLWKGGSGIGASDKRPPFLKPVNFSIPGWNTEANEVRVNYELIDYGVKITKIKTDGTALFWVSAPNHIDNIAWYKVSGVSTGKGIRFGAETRNSTWTVIAETDGIYKVDWTNLVDSTGNRTLPCILSNGWIGDCNIIIEQIDPCLNGLCLDGITDFGKVIGMPIYKDYTFIIDRQIITNDASRGIVASKSESAGDVTKQGAFIFEYLSTNAISTWSYYKNNSLVANSDSNRNISYQSKYSYNGKGIEIGEAKDSDKLWIGTIRDNDERFANIAIYSLMSFPYSMSEFLIERQLKKHKLGTLYPNMMEFRPIIKSNIDTLKINYWDKDWNVVNVGDYVSVGNDIKTNITVPNGYKVSKVTSDAFDNITIEKSSTDFIYDVKFYGIKKSPQKITMTIEQDENYVKFEPVITSNVEYVRLDFYLNNYQKRINIGDYIPKDAYLRANFYLKNNVDELTVFTFNGVNIGYRRSSVDDTAFNINQIYNYDSPQEVNITIDEYIIYEDIVQPYPVLLRFNDENGNEVSWGGKFRVGSTITRIESFYENNLIDGLYIVRNPKLNGNNLITPTHVVEKSMVFTCDTEYLLDNNEPKCILSPSRLRIPNSSYKLLGYIPDISGHGNHGVIHNSAYAEGSGVNEDGSYQFDGVDDFVTIPTVTGGGKQVLMKVNNNTINSMLYDQRSSGASPNSLYNDFAIYNTNTVDNNLIAYQSRLVGNTYIDGILNTNITCEDLLGVLHNITITCDIVAPNNGVVPNIGRGGVLKDLYSKVALYDFMLFDNISTEDKIKELNEYVGIEAKVELPPYYWDAYGKTNLDEDKATIQQRGVAEGDYDITNYNHAYDKMSGYGGYNLGRFDKSWASSSSSNTSIKVVQRNPYDITLKKLGGNSDWEFNNTALKVISNPVSVKFKSNKNIRVTCDYHYYPVGGNSEGTPLGITSKDLIANKDAIITISPISQENIDKYNIDVNRGYYLIYFQLSSTLAVNEEVIIEMLPLYPNGLVYDGVTDYSENANIPMFDDFTFLVKASLPNGFTGSGGAIAKKGSNTQVISGGYDFVYALDSNANEANKNSYWSFGKALLVSTGAIDPPLIGYMTKTNVNGIPTTAGTNPSIEGITFSRWSGYISMIFYKAILYPKTIPLLQINFLKNLMERDEIIDLDNPIFKK